MCGWRWCSTCDSGGSIDRGAGYGGSSARPVIIEFKTKGIYLQPRSRRFADTVGLRSRGLTTFSEGFGESSSTLRYIWMCVRIDFRERFELFGDGVDCAIGGIVKVLSDFGYT